MNFETKCQHAQEISARIFLYVTEAGLTFPEAVTRAETTTICPPLAFKAGVSSAQKLLSITA